MMMIKLLIAFGVTMLVGSIGSALNRDIRPYINVATLLACMIIINVVVGIIRFIIE